MIWHMTVYRHPLFYPFVLYIENIWDIVPSMGITVVRHLKQILVS